MAAAPRCRGLRKAVEFDIQLETEECVRGQQQRLLPLPGGRAALLAAAGARPVQLGDAHRELEAELRKMAPPNGRTVLIFRSPCGCPKGRMEVWGAKKGPSSASQGSLELAQELPADTSLGLLSAAVDAVPFSSIELKNGLKPSRIPVPDDAGGAKSRGLSVVILLRALLRYPSSLGKEF
uniref:Uncharacterized protein n=1 Tax=Oryza barthii TaxID=65489 RepID=A0A0D3G966_9ORYZ